MLYRYKFYIDKFLIEKWQSGQKKQATGERDRPERANAFNQNKINPAAFKVYPLCIIFLMHNILNETSCHLYTLSALPSSAYTLAYTLSYDSHMNRAVVVVVVVSVNTPVNLACIGNIQR